MKLNKIIISIGLIITALAVIAYYNNQDKSEIESSDKPNEPVNEISITTQQDAIINNITVFLENSGSMFSYERGANNYFRTDINKLFDLLNDTQEKIPEWNFLAVNSDIHELDINLNHFTDGNIVYTQDVRIGEMTQTDFSIIFERTLQNANNNDGLSILISDLIYSTQNQDNNGAESVAASFESLVKREFRESSKETAIIVMKMNSPYRGNYYPNFSDLPSFPIDQNRPYYILLIGKNSIINSLVKSKKLNNYEVLKNEFSGFEDYFVFFNPDKTSNIYYTALPYSSKPVLFSASKETLKGNNPIKSLFFRSNIANSNGSFYLAIDFMGISMFNNYLNNITNYSISTNNFSIDSIASVTDLSLAQLDKRKLLTCTNILQINVSNIHEMAMILKLKNKMPDWIYNTSSLTDGIDNTVGTNTTFGFEYFMKGLRSAYGVKDDLFSININLKQD